MARSGFFVLWLLFTPATAAELDPMTGLIIAPGWELVRSYCGTCHTHGLVTSQRGDATFWLDTIRWMQRTQNLPQLYAEHERTIVEYLAGNYHETDWGRRPRLSARLLPEPAG
ncbi:MAG: hypothetical protein O7B25_17650 [Gammaproteobacteria bacterium]|nr:hypothetical protein [Gammaproteobacteria bacterium]